MIKLFMHGVIDGMSPFCDTHGNALNTLHLTNMMINCSVTICIHCK